MLYGSSPISRLQGKNDRDASAYQRSLQNTVLQSKSVFVCIISKLNELFQHLTKLCFVATECVTALSVDSILQMQLLKAGALWYLLLFMFSYDFTLDEGGVEKSADANQQEVSNRLAKEAVRACAALGGYLQGEHETPSNPVTRGILEMLLSPYLANQLAKARPEEVSTCFFLGRSRVILFNFCRY